jgi:hypothetical protein
MSRLWITSGFSVAVLTVIIGGCSQNAGRQNPSGVTLLKPSPVYQRVEDAGSGGGGSTIGDITVQGQFTFTTGSGTLSGPYSGSLVIPTPNLIFVFLGSLTGTGRLADVVLADHSLGTIDTTASTQHLTFRFHLTQSGQLYEVDADVPLTTNLTADATCSSGMRRTIAMDGSIPQFGRTSIVLSHCEPVL